jgi:hypothetical protein
MNLVLQIVSFAVGALIVAGTLASAVTTMVVPRGVPARITRTVFISIRRLFMLFIRKGADYERQDKVMALYAPATLLLLLQVWLALVLIGYGLMYWPLELNSFGTALAESGSALLTLGFEKPSPGPATFLAFTEAAVGLTLLALLIAYLPSIYQIFSRREANVAMLEVRAGSPPVAAEMIMRLHRIERLDDLTSLWERWEAWFVDLEETHTSLPVLVFFRSPKPEHSWVTAGGALLDMASITLTTVDRPHEPETNLCIRAGYVAFRRIADFFGIHYDPDPAPGDPISVTRHEFDEAYDTMHAAGVPLKPDRDQCWRDFAGWRVNYDAALLGLASITQAPYAPWSSDRSPSFRPPRIFMRRRQRAPMGPSRDA